MSAIPSHPMDRLNESGDIGFAHGRARKDNPYPIDWPQRETWFAQWDAKAEEAGRLVAANAAGALYKAALEAASLLRDMRNSPRALTSRSTRYRDTEIALSNALTKAQAAASKQASSTPATETA